MLHPPTFFAWWRCPTSSTVASMLHSLQSSMEQLARRRLRQELGIRDDAAGAEAARLKLLEEIKKTREEQDAVRRRNPILVYVEKLAAADESAWQDNLEGMGNTPDIPKLFRHAGKVFPALLRDSMGIFFLAVTASLQPQPSSCPYSST